MNVFTYCTGIAASFSEIPEARKSLLDRLAGHIHSKVIEGAPVRLIYICTHNSRRSHFGQVWAHVAADFYGIADVKTYSGGTVATAFNVHAREALQRIGFRIDSTGNEPNKLFQLTYDETKPPIECFSKCYDHHENPVSGFAAVMTCGEAETNCPFIPGAEFRIATTYEDPKNFDGTPEQDLKYDERCRQIAVETFYVFSRVAESLKP